MIKVFEKHPILMLLFFAILNVIAELVEVSL